jgi:hypothetical protein
MSSKSTDTIKTVISTVGLIAGVTLSLNELSRRHLPLYVTAGIVAVTLAVIAGEILSARRKSVRATAERAADAAAEAACAGATVRRVRPASDPGEAAIGRDPDGRFVIRVGRPRRGGTRA